MKKKIMDVVINYKFNDIGAKMTLVLLHGWGQNIAMMEPVAKLFQDRYNWTKEEANELYKLTNEKVYFEIKDNEEIVKTYMYNEKIEIPVFKSNTNESIIFNLLFGICLLVGIGGLYYEKRFN